MQTRFAHLQFNIAPANLPFYRDLMPFLGWSPIYENETMLGVGAGGPETLWFIGSANASSNDYDGPGMNHIALAAASVTDVDAAAAYLAERGVAALFETPRHRPEFSADETQTYYQVMFETPDRILFEIVYTGPREA